MIPVDVGKWSLDKWQSMFVSIYSEKNARYSVQDVGFRLLEEVGELVYPIKQLDLKTIRWQLPDVFAWLCTLISTISDVKLSEILWAKFSNGCPGCHRFVDCSCSDIIEALETPGGGRNQESKLPLLVAQRKLKSMNDWQKFFCDMYGKKNNASMDPLAVMARLIEDVGAISKLIRTRGRQEDVHSKIASSVAWLFGLCNRLSSLYEGDKSVKLSEMVWDKYPDHCARCHKSPCTCPAPIYRVFVSYPKELDTEKEALKAQIESRLSLEVVAFPDFQGVSVREGIMKRAFQLINTCDATVVLIGHAFSADVYAEFREADYRLEPNHIFIGVKRGDKDPKNDSFIEDIRHKNIYDEFKDEEDLSKKIIERLKRAIQEFKKWERE